MRNLGSKVSRVLDSTDRSFTEVVFQPLRPPLDSEFNLLQDIQNSALQNLAKGLKTSGFLSMGPVTGYPVTITVTPIAPPPPLYVPGSDEDADDLIVQPPPPVVNDKVAWKYVIKFANPFALVNGKLLQVGAGTNQFQAGSQVNIWTALSGLETEEVFIMNSNPATGSRDDLVFLEVWEELLNTTSPINKFGNAQTAESQFPNDMIDPNVNRETTIRTQLRYRIRVSEGVDFVSFPQGLGSPSVFAQGGKSANNPSYTFSPTPQGHFIAGNGSAQSSTDLNTVDGYVYALPIAAVHRKNQTAYSVTNPNGASGTLFSGVSDRPDGIFTDEINNVDIEDLRHLVDLGFDYDGVISEALEAVMGAVPHRLILGEHPDLFSTVNLQLDAISGVPIANVNQTLLRRPNGFARTFSDKEITQREARYIQSGSVNVSNQLELPPPQFYSSSDTTQYKTYNPFIGAVNPPVVRNAVSGAIVQGDSSVGIGGWLNLGDRINKAEVTFKPLNVSDVQGKQLIIDYDLVIPGGTGLFQLPRKMYSVQDKVNNAPISFTEDGFIKIEDVSRKTLGFQDSIQVNPFRNFATPTSLNESYRGAAFERVYYVVGNGSSSVTIPATIDNIPVLNVYRVQFASSANSTGGADIPLGFASQPKILKNVDGSFTINFQSYFPTPQQAIRVTLLMQGNACGIMRPNKGIGDFIQTAYISFPSTGATSYSFAPVSNSQHPIEFVYALTGLQSFDGMHYAAYYSTSTNTAGFWTEIGTVTGLGTPFVTINFLTPPPAGTIITVPIMGSFAPQAASQYVLTYDYVPYQGLSNLLADSEQMTAEVLYLSPKAMVTTNGTGGDGSVWEGLADVISRFPINITDPGYIFDRSSLELPRQKATGSTKYIDYSFDNYASTSTLKVGDVLTLTKQPTAHPKTMARGCSLDAPLISYRVEDLVENITENLSQQSDGTNRVFKVSHEIMSVQGQSCLTRTWLLQGIAVFTPSSNVVSGLSASFTKQIRPGFQIRPVGTTAWYKVFKVLNDTSLLLTSNYTGAAITGQWELYSPAMIVTKNGIELGPNDFDIVLGKDKLLTFAVAPQISDNVVINYKTGTNTLNCLYGLAVGTSGVLKGELLLFTLTTTSSKETIFSPEFNLLNVGGANQLIFNNNIEIPALEGTLNHGNRVVIAADFFYLKTRRFNVNQKV